MKRLRRPFGLTLAALIIGLGVLAGYILKHPVPVVLMIHDIAEIKNHPLHLTPKRLSSLLQKAQNKNHPILISSDSSEENIYKIFYPEIRKHQLPAVVFLVTSWVGQEGMLTWDQIREMDQNGIQFGSHSVSHPWLPDLTDAEIQHELITSRKILEKELGHPVTDFAYPFGAFDARVKKCVAECGYTRAYATAPGRKIPDDDPLTLKRVFINDAAFAYPGFTLLALSKYYVATRETALALLHIQAPQKPADWSYPDWKKTQ